MKWPTGIRVRLLLLACVCTLPVFALLAYDAWHASMQNIDDARSDLQVHATSAAADLDKDLQSGRLLLQSMAQIPAIANLTPGDCARQLALLAAPYAQIGTASGIAPDGTLQCTIEPGTGAPANLADRDYFAKAVASGEPVVGATLLSRRAGAYVVPIALAVRDASGRPTAVLVVGVSLSRFAVDKATNWTDEGTALTLWDRDTSVLFRWPDPTDWVGKSYADTSISRELNARPNGYFEVGGVDGIERVGGLAPVGTTGLRLTLSIPREALLAPHREALLRNVGLLALIVLIAFAIAWMVAEITIRRPLSALARVAGRMREGDLAARMSPPYSRDELGVVARSFDTMAETLATQIAALREGEDRLRQNLALTRETEQRVRQQLEHMNLLDQITRSIGERLDLQSIFQVVVRTLEDSLPVDFCCVALHDPTTNTLRVERIGVKSDPVARLLELGERSAFSVDNNGLARCMSGRLVYEPDIGAVDFPFPRRLAQGGMRSLVLAPLRLESNVFGVLVAARREAKAFSSVECEFLRQLSEHVGLGAGQAQLHDALRQAYEDLRQSQQVVMQEERLRALGQMASGIAHDINNALSPVSLYTESLLETETGLSERARGYLVTIQRAVEDVAQTVARMREFYRQREAQIDLAPVQLNDIAQQVLDLTRARWSDMSLRQGVVIEAKTELAAGLSQVTGVESEIREALTNLVLNAVDAMPEGGTLTLRTRMQSVRTGAPRDGVVIEVSDSGVGMDEDTRRRCLEPFFTTKGERGTGLGLAMVFGIVRRHGGELEIDSEAGRGTTVRLVFGVRSDSATPAHPVGSYSVPTRLRVLIVDDDPVLLKSLTDTLEADGHVITSANGGKEGIAAFQAALASAKPFAAVITDLGMPYVDGRKVAAAVKQASPATPVILLTGWGQRLVAEGDIPECVDRVLPKPPRLRDLRDALGSLCMAEAGE